MQKYRNRLIAGFGLALAIYIGMLIFMDNSGQFNDGVITALSDFPWWLLIPLSLTQVSAALFRFWEWQYFLGVIGARDKISVKDSAIIYVSAFTLVVSPGKVAEVLKVVLLKMKTGVPVTRSAPIPIAERVVDGLAVIVTLFLTMLLAGSILELGDYRHASEGIIFTSAALLGFGLVAVQIKSFAYFCLNLLGYLPVVDRLKDPLTAFYESSREIFSLRHLLPTMMMGLGVYISSTIGYILILWGFGLDITWTLFVQAAFMVGVVSAIGALSFVPNGAGVTEISNAAMLMAIVAPTNPEMTLGLAAAAALLQGFFHKWFRAVVGLCVGFIYRKRLFTPELEQEIAALEAEHVTRSTSQQYAVSAD